MADPEDTAAAEAARLARRQLAWRAALITPLIVAPVWSALLTPVWPTAQLTTWSGCILVLLSAVCAYTDMRWHRIFNWATYTAFLWALVLNVALFLTQGSEAPLSPGFGSAPLPWLRLGAIGLPGMVLSAAVVFVLMFVLYRLSGGGAGDVKLTTAVAAYLGLERSFAMLVYSYIAAGTYGVCLLIWHVGPWNSVCYATRKCGNRFFPGWVAPASDESHRALLMTRLPLGGFFALGTLVVLSEVIEW